MDKILNILVTGAKGQLGRSIQAETSGIRDNYLFTDVEELDITDPIAVKKFIDKHDIDVIVNCAAFTNVDAAEDKEDIANLINGEAPGILADAIKEKNGTLIHISTDYVFGGSGKNTPITEDQEPSPTGAYGRSKLLGEEKIKDTNASSIIIRTAWLYSDYGNNFVDKILSLLNSRDSIKVVFDQCGTPTYATDLAKAIVTIINERKFKGNEGIYHFSNEGVCSWFDFAFEAARTAGLKEKEVLPCHSNEFPSKVTRPPYSVLDKAKFKETFSYTIPHWQESLEKCLAKRI